MLSNKERRTKNDEPCGSGRSRLAPRASFFVFRLWFFVLSSSFVVPTVSCASAAQDASPDVVAMERAALDRWGKGDPQGYLEIMANDVTYFDPMQDKRIDGLEAMKKMLAPITGKVKVSRFDMIDPKVQRYGDAALLTFNLVSYVKQPDGQERAVARWNSSELYGRVDGQWRIVHSHWSYIKPELKQPVTEISQ